MIKKKAVIVLSVTIGVLCIVLGVLFVQYLFLANENAVMKMKLLEWEHFYNEDYLAEVSSYENKQTELETQISQLNDEAYGMKAHGRLKVEGNTLCGEMGETVLLKGMSTHGISWYPRYTSAGAFETIKEYGANVVRLSVYSEQPGSYVYKEKENLDYLYTAIENALSLNMYVIVDWHVLKDENPNVKLKEAKEFFGEISAHYGNHEGILYEICNEPNGDTTWEDVTAYANEVIPLIRENAPDSVVIVGTPNFCIDVEAAAKNPLPYENLLYSLHVYFDLSKEDANFGNANWYASKLDLGIPVIVSEWGMKNTDGQTYPEQVYYFLDILKDRNISWCNWSLSNSDESYSLIQSECEALSGWTDNDLTVSGKIVVNALGE